MADYDIEQLERLHRAVLEALRNAQGGTAATDLVTKVQKNCRVRKEEVQRMVRSLMERGDVIIGPNLKLKAAPEVPDVTSRDHTG